MAVFFKLWNGTESNDYRSRQPADERATSVDFTATASHNLPHPSLGCGK